jgi:hypothetical protein
LQTIFANLGEELFVAYSLSAPTPLQPFVVLPHQLGLTLLSAEQTDKQDASAIDGK